MVKSRKIQILLFIASIGFMYLLYNIKLQNSYDRAFIRVNLDKQQQQEIVIDLGKQGFFKRLLQPNKTTIYITCETKAKNISCSIEQMDCLLSQSSKKGAWKELSDGEVLKEYFGTLPINMEITLPDDSMNRHFISNGRLNFYSGGKPYNTINFKFINSNGS